MKISDLTYSVWKNVTQENEDVFSIFYVTASNNVREVWSGNRSFQFSTIVDADYFSDWQQAFESASTAVSSSQDAMALLIGLNNLKAQPNESGVPVVTIDGRQSDKAIKVTVVGREGSETTQATHNYANPMTWYTNSDRHISSSMFNSGDNRIFSSSFNMWIDMTHGLYHCEDKVANDYLVDVFVDGEKKNAREPWAASGGDFDIVYESGSIEFFSEVTGTVTANFSVPAGSTWILKPKQGLIIDIEQAEVQFSHDVGFTDTVMFVVYGYTIVFAPHLAESNGGPYPDTMLIPIDTTRYKTLTQLIDEALGSFPEIPAIGGSRGTKSSMFGFPFRYGTVRRLWSSYGMELRISLQNNIQFTGSHATATFYCVSRAESDVA